MCFICWYLCLNESMLCKADVFIEWCFFYTSDYVDLLNTCKTCSDTFILMVQKTTYKTLPSLCVSLFSSFYFLHSPPSLFLFLTLFPWSSVIHFLTHCHYINLLWSPSSAHTFVHIFKLGYWSNFLSVPLPAECIPFALSHCTSLLSTMWEVLHNLKTL